MKTCVLIPTYNNAPKLEPVLKQVIEQGLPVLVVNDGSTDQTLEILTRYSDRIQLISYDQNRGKGYALLTGFKEAGRLNFDSVITIDSDGQHNPDDIAKMLSEQQKNPGAVLMGSRDLEGAGAPGKSSFGNKFSNFWFWVETGFRLPDTQTGFRLYPLKPLLSKSYLTTGFAFEVESIVKLAWSGVSFIPVKIDVDYPEDRISHFQPLKDFMRISFLNTWLFIQALFYYIPKRWIRRLMGKSRY